MISRLILPVLALTAAAVLARSELASHIEVRSAPAAVELTPRASGRRLLVLPALEFSFELEPQCVNGLRAESLSISVADTRETVTLSADDQPVITTTLTLPQQQTAPLAVVDFCQLQDDRAAEDLQLESQELLVRGAFTAHLSLLCTNDEQHALVYASQSLDVTLRCKPADQSPSADSAAR